MYIGNVGIEGRLALAPMAGVADAAFRTVCREQGAALAYTEMVSAKALVYQDSKTRQLLQRGLGDFPLAVQLFGSEPEVMAEAVKKVFDIEGFELVDINMGCPTGKIVKNGEGCALMQDAALAAKIIAAVVKASPVPVTVKFRKGWDKGSVNAVDFARMAEAEGASALAIHGRTRAQLYSGKADWDIIRAVKQAVNIPVLANGDVFEPEDARHILDYTGADMALIGRGSMGNPWIFSRGKAAVDGEEIPPLPPIARRIDVALRQFELALSMKGEHIACLEARKHYNWYLKGVPYSGYFKEQVTKFAVADDVYRITRQIKEELK
jgi:tRNA-dihydrouridine synthase B